MELTNLLALAAGYKAGKYQPLDVVEVVIERINCAGDDHVWISRVAEDQLRQRARQLMSGRTKGPLYGIPFAVKDNIDIAGFPTTAGCSKFSYEPRRTAPVVQHLIDAGAILVGKTNMDQFALGLTGVRSPYGVPRNPYGATYIPGGSSSGSAVAVASRLVTFALGTDTAGSIRVPAGFNNIVGLKSTRGLLSIRGIIPACQSLDCSAIMAADVQSADLVLNCTAVFDPEDPFSRPAPNRWDETPITTVGVLRPEHRQFFGDRDAPIVYEAGIKRLEQLSIACEPIDFTPFREVAELLYNGAWMAEREVAIGDFVRRNPEAVIPVTRDSILNSCRYSAADYFRGFHRLKELERVVEAVWGKVGALFVPTAPAIYKVDDALNDPTGSVQKLSHYTNFVNLLDLCAVAIPSGFTAAGLPVGATLIAPAFRDKAVIALSKRYETQTEKVPRTAH